MKECEVRSSLRFVLSGNELTVEFTIESFFSKIIVLFREDQIEITG